MHGAKQPPPYVIMKRCVFILVWATVLGAARAQVAPSNLETYQILAKRCLAEAPGVAQTFALAAPGVMPYLRTTLVDAWRAEGRTIFLADTSYQAPAQEMPRLDYAVERAAVTYAPARRKHVGRQVSLEVRYTFASHQGRILAGDRCSELHSDVVLRRDISALETEAFPETKGVLPRAGWTRRYLEPAALATATALTVFLFFNLRSEGG